MLDVIESYKRLEENDDIVLAYKGNATDELFSCIIELAESKLEKIEFSSRLKKKVFNILVEIVQNIYHHFDEYQSDQDEFYSVVFLLLKNKEGGYDIYSGNHVMKERVNDLKSRLDLINSMSIEEVKELYRSKLENGQLSERGGAGLGILDIARKSGQQLNYDFKVVNQDFSFFSLKVSINA